MTDDGHKSYQYGCLVKRLRICSNLVEKSNGLDTIKKSYIKNKNGSARLSNISASTPQVQVIEENEMLKNEVNSLKYTIKQHEGEIISLKNEVKELENGFKDKETEVGDLRKLACSNKNAAEDIDNLKEKTFELETENKRYVCELDKLADELHETKIELTKQYENLRTKNKEIDKLRKDNKNLKAEQKKVIEKKVSEEICKKFDHKSQQAQINITPVNNSENSELPCKVCDEEFESEKAFNVHVNLEHESNVATSNAFELFGEPASKVEENITAKVDTKATKIDFENFQEAFQNFITNFKEDPSEPPKYFTLATDMMKNNYNMFHVKLKEV